MTGHGAARGGSTLTLLFLVFLTLKLTSVINWSWWWVTAPLWGQFAGCLLIFGGILAAAWLATRRVPQTRYAR